MAIKYNAAVLGCGAIFNRHLAAITHNSEHFNLVGIYDPINEIKERYVKELGVKGYSKEEDVYADPNVNCVIILTPNYLHFDQAVLAIRNNKHVIVEKPSVFFANEVTELESLAKKHNVDIFCILQVRLTPSVTIAKRILEEKLLGDIRGASLIQRWQRPNNYFSLWRGEMKTGGGVLREFGIHYLDIMQFLLGLPQVSYAQFFQKKIQSGDVNDVVYALLDFKTFGGSFEVSLACEPKNLECSLSILGSNGFLKLGGKALDEIVASEFLSPETMDKVNEIKEDILTQGALTPLIPGASPYHPELYRQIIINPDRFRLAATYNVIKLIEDTYEFGAEDGKRK